MGYLKCDTCKSWFDTIKGVCKCAVVKPDVGAVVTPSVQPRRTPAPSSGAVPLPIRSPSVTAPPQRTTVTPPGAVHGSQAVAIGDELARLRLASEARRGGPANFAGKFAYRGVSSGPDVYELRGGFASHRITTLELARSTLQSLANKDDGLSQYAFRWQERKDKADGYFLSTGLSETESYDNYPYLYRIDIGGLVKRSWDAFPTLPQAIENCVLYTDNANVAASTMIAIICLSGGVGRSYELLIMSPVPPALCQVAYPKDSKTYISFAEWKRLTAPTVV